jgi:hypothetical protein
LPTRADRAFAPDPNLENTVLRGRWAGGKDGIEDHGWLPITGWWNRRHFFLTSVAITCLCPLIPAERREKRLKIVTGLIRVASKKLSENRE